MKKQFLPAGRLNSPRGLRGELRFDCWCDDADFLVGVVKLYTDEKGSAALNVKEYRPNIPSVIFEGYDDRTKAAALTGRTLWFDRNDIELAEGQVFNDDLIGLDVFDAETNKKIGELTAIDEVARHFIYEITLLSGEKKQIPAVEAFVKSLDPDTGIRIHFWEEA